MGGAAKSIASEIAGAFGGKLNTTISTSLSLFQEMAKGGIWGAMTVAVNSAVSFIAAKWTEAKEAARKYADLCRTEIVNGMKAVVDSFGGVSKAIAETNAEAKELMAVTNGEIATRAELKIHEINVKALQSITDNMTAATRAAIMAEAQLEQAEVRAAAATEQAANVRERVVEAVFLDADPVRFAVPGEDAVRRASHACLRAKGHCRAVHARLHTPLSCRLVPEGGLSGMNRFSVLVQISKKTSLGIPDEVLGSLRKHEERLVHCAYSSKCHPR